MPYVLTIYYLSQFTFQDVIFLYIALFERWVWTPPMEQIDGSCFDRQIWLAFVMVLFIWVRLLKCNSCYLYCMCVFTNETLYVYFLYLNHTPQRQGAACEIEIQMTYDIKACSRALNWLWDDWMLYCSPRISAWIWDAYDLCRRKCQDYVYATWEYWSTM